LPNCSNVVFMAKSWLYLLLGLGLLSSQAVFDYVFVEWATTNGNTLAAASAVVGVLVTIYFINAFSDMRLARQEEQRFKNIKKIAFRSLSQTVNDVGRRLIAPIAGIDIFQAGIPHVTEDDVARYRNRLAENDLAPLSANSGFWGSIPTETLVRRIEKLSKDPSFIDEMFRASSRARRDLQSALADWAPIMVRVPRAYEDLSAGWPLADHIVRLTEAWRTIQIAQRDGGDLELDEVCRIFVETVWTYRDWLEQLQANAELPTRGALVEDEDWKNQV
jgi:hypothetical protein